MFDVMVKSPENLGTTARSEVMTSTVLYMSMSLDGFIAGPNESLENGLGDGGERLHEWVFADAEDGDDVRAAAGRLRGRRWDGCRRGCSRTAQGQGDSGEAMAKPG